MADQFTVTTSVSGFSRILGSIGGALVGILLVVVAFPLLWWNEGRAVRTARGLSEGASAVVEVTADTVDVAHDGKLVHLTGQATPHGTLTDHEFNVSTEAIKLVRTVEMYQWHEDNKSRTKQKFGGGQDTTTTYTYKTQWSSSPIDSSAFQQPAGHENPAAPPWKAETLTASTVTLGAFTLSPGLVALIDQRQRWQLDETNQRALPAGMGVTLSDGGYYRGTDPHSPRVGDVRITYEVVQPLAVSVVAVQRGSSFEAFQTKSGTSVLLLQAGTLTANDMFKTARTSNAWLTWILRGVGFLVMLIGLALVFRPLAVVGSVIPLAGRLLSAGIGIVAFLVAFALSLVTIAVAWFAYRPLLAIGLLAAAAGTLVLLLARHRSAMAARGRPAAV